MDAAKGMIRAAYLACAAMALVPGCREEAGVAAQAVPATGSIADNFDDGLCVAPCPGAIWDDTQEIEGSVTVRDGILSATARPRFSIVPKAALIARPGRFGSGSRIRVMFDIRIAPGTPVNSVHLLDIECAKCGVSGNPGIRMYLRDGRLRIDRSKIGIADAWTNDRAAQMVAGQWHRIEAEIDLGQGDDGGVRLMLDGDSVLSKRGATLLPQSGAFADRLQFGITATSNDVPVSAQFDNFRASVAR